MAPSTVCQLTENASIESQKILNLSRRQRLIYEKISKFNPKAIIAGDFASFLIGWKNNFNYIDIFVPCNGRIKGLSRRTQCLLNIIKKECSPFVSGLDDVEFEVLHNHQESSLNHRGVINIDIANIRISVINVPPWPMHLTLNQQKNWCIFYLLASMNLTLNRVAIKDFDDRGTVFTIFGQKEMGLREVRLKIEYTRNAIRLLNKRRRLKEALALRTKNTDPIRNQINHLEDRYMWLQSFDPSWLLKNSNIVPNLSGITLNQLVYAVNEDLKYALPACLIDIEVQIREDDPGLFEKTKKLYCQYFHNNFELRAQEWNLTKLRRVGETCSCGNIDESMPVVYI